jgi:hypothetical protein
MFLVVGMPAWEGVSSLKMYVKPGTILSRIITIIKMPVLSYRELLYDL